MAGHREEASQLLPLDQEDIGRKSDESGSSASTTSLVFERIGERADAEKDGKVLNGNGHTTMVTPKFPPRGDSLPYADDEHAQHLLEDEDKEDDYDLENAAFIKNTSEKSVD